MNLDELTKMFDFNEEYTSTIKGEVSTNLKECLERLNDKILTFHYKEFCEARNKSSRKVSKEKMVDFCYKMIIETFYRLIIMNVIPRMDDILNSEIVEFDPIFYSLSFMFGFKKDKKITYIIPDELRNIYNEVNLKNSDMNKQKFALFLGLYIVINGIITKDFIPKIVENHNINLDDNTINKCLTELNVDIIFDNYYTIINENMKKNPEQYKKQLKPLIDRKEDNSYKLLNNEVILPYDKTFIVTEVISITGNDKNDISVFELLRYHDLDIEKSVDIYSKNLKLSKKEKENLENVLYKYLDELRFWDINGRTIDEYDEYTEIMDVLMKKVPKVIP